MDQTQKDYRQEIVEKIRENYLSVTLGVLVFLVALTLIFRSGDADQQADSQQPDTQDAPKTYVVQQGDSVSSIARDQLGSMDYADELVEANKLENPDQIEVGTELTLPEVAGDTTSDEKASEEGDLNGDGAVTEKPGQTITITGSTYTVKKGDHLWDIAARAYGDGNMYTRIIEANKLRNPDRLVEGTILTIPRPSSK